MCALSAHCTHSPDAPATTQVGDGTTTVVVLSGEFLREAKPYVEEGVHPRVRRPLHCPAAPCRAVPCRPAQPVVCCRPSPDRQRATTGNLHPTKPPQHPICTHPPCIHPQSIIKSYRQAALLAVEKVKELSVSLEGKSEAEKRELLRKCASTSLNSKLVSRHVIFPSALGTACCRFSRDVCASSSIYFKLTQRAGSCRFCRGVCTLVCSPQHAITPHTQVSGKKDGFSEMMVVS